MVCMDDEEFGAKASTYTSALCLLSGLSQCHAEKVLGTSVSLPTEQPVLPAEARLWGCRVFRVCSNYWSPVHG